MSLSIPQQRALVILPKLTGLTSCFLSCVIVASIARDPTKRSKVYHRLIMGMSISDISSSLWLSLSTWPISAETGILWAVGTRASCTAQGFFTQFGVASPVYNVSLSLYYLLTVRYSWNEHRLRRIEPFFHIVPILWAFGTAVAGVVLQMFNSANLWCWIADSPGRNESTDVYRFAFFYGPLWITMVAVTVHLILVFLYVRKITLRSEQYATTTDTTTTTTLATTLAMTLAATTQQQQQQPPTRGQGRGGGETRRSQSRSQGGGSLPLSSSVEESIIDEDEDEDTSTTEFNHDHTLASTNKDDEEEEDMVYFDQGFEDVNAVATVSPRRRSSLLFRSAAYALRRTLQRGIGGTNNNTNTNTTNNGRMDSRTSVRRRNQQAQQQRQQRRNKQFGQRRRQVAHQCLRYALSFYWTWIPISLVRILQMMAPPKSVYALFLLAAINTPCQGLPNFWVYLWPLLYKAQTQHPSRNVVAWIRLSLSPAANHGTETPIGSQRGDGGDGLRHGEEDPKLEEGVVDVDYDTYDDAKDNPRKIHSCSHSEHAKGIDGI